MAHALVGFLILAIGLALPIKLIYRIILLVVIIVLNAARMKLCENKKKDDDSLVDSAETASRCPHELITNPNKKQLKT